MTCISANEARAISIQAYIGGEDVVNADFKLRRVKIHISWEDS